MKMSIYGVVCPECNGEGNHIITANTGMGLRTVKESCDECDGTGCQTAHENRDGIEWERE